MRRAIPVLIAVSCATLQADVTVRYQTEMKGSFQALMQQAGTSFNAAMPHETKLCIKGAKNYAEYGGAHTIGDTSTKQMTLLDQDGKKYATTTTEEYFKSIKSAIPAIPPAVAAMMASMKIKTESKVTGQTDTIQGIQAEEHEVVLSLEAPEMAGMPAGPMLRVVMHIWTAKPSEVDRVPALHELVKYNSSEIAALNSGGGIKQMLDMIPGLGQGLSSAMQELSQVATMRMKVELFMPTLAAMMKSMPAGSNPLGKVDPNGALMEVTQNLVELSTEPIADSQFEIPAGYQQESLDEYVKTYLGHMIPAAK